MLSNKLYDKLNYINMIALPALATAVIALDQIQDIGDGVKYAGIIVVFNTLLGTLLGVSTRQYNKNAYVGDMIVEPDDGIQKHTLQLNDDVDPMQLQKRKEVRFRVNPK